MTNKVVQIPVDGAAFRAHIKRSAISKLRRLAAEHNVCVTWPDSTYEPAESARVQCKECDEQWTLAITKDWVKNWWRCPKGCNREPHERLNA
jgi:hypothetical protein